MIEIVLLSVTLALGGSLAAAASHWGRGATIATQAGLAALILSPIASFVLDPDWLAGLNHTATSALALAALPVGLRLGSDLRRGAKPSRTAAQTALGTAPATLSALAVWALLGALIQANHPLDWLAVAPIAMLTFAVGLSTPIRGRAAAPIAALIVALAFISLQSGALIFAISGVLGAAIGGACGLLGFGGTLGRSTRLGLAAFGILSMGLLGLDPLCMGACAGLAFGLIARDGRCAARLSLRAQLALLLVLPLMMLTWPTTTTWQTPLFAIAFAGVLVFGAWKRPQDPRTTPPARFTSPRPSRPPVQPRSVAPASAPRSSPPTSPTPPPRPHHSSPPR